MKTLAVISAIAILSILALSVVGQTAAFALSAASYTLKPSFTSLNSGKWSKVWQDSSTPTTYFVDVSTTQIKMERINNANGSINSTATYALPGSGNAAISSIEKVGGVNRVYYVQMINSTFVSAGIVNIDTGTSISTATLAMTNTGSGNEYPAVATTKNAVYYFFKNIAGGNIEAYYTGRAFGAVTTITSGLNTGNGGTDKVACDVSTDGAATAQDVVYCAVPTTNQPHAYKITSAAVTSLGSIGSAASGSSAGLVSISGKAIVRISTSGVTNTYTIDKSTDTLSTSLYTDTWLTWQNQQYDFDGTTRSYKSGSAPYYATTAKALGWNAQTGTLQPMTLYSETITSSTGTIAGVSSTFYRISDSLIVTGSGTTWTPEVVTATTTFNPTTYTEKLYSALTSNTTIITAGGLIHLVCDANYNYPLANPVLTGNSTDCTKWLVTPDSSTTIGRSIYGPFASNSNLVHAGVFTAYTFALSQGDPTVYRLYSSYNGKTVDVADFDSSGQAQQYYLFGQCYDVSIKNVNSGASILFGNICANDATTKSINLASITIPSNWLGVTWFHNATRDYSNATNNSIRFDVMKSQQPYNVSIHVTDHIKESLMTYNQWFNYTNVSNMTTIVQSGFLNNQTVYITAYENNVPVASNILGAKSYSIPNIFAPFGNLFGVPLVATVIVGVAAIWRKENAYFGIVVTLATAGILFTLGMFSIDPAVWAVIIVLGAVGILMGVKRS